MMLTSDLFEDLFVLEMANNHWGHLERAFQIIESYAAVVKRYNVKAAIKFQLRNVDSFIHADFKGRKDIRYVWKTEKTALSQADYAKIVECILHNGLIPMATVFDEPSTAFACDLKLPLLKLASSDISDHTLIDGLLKTKKPLIASTGGASLAAIDGLVKAYANANVPLALNHCVSIYPCEDEHLEINQIDFFKKRYPDLVIGFSTHEYGDWTSSMLLSYAKGARTWERHIDIDNGDYEVSSYCSTPEKIALWFEAYQKAKLMCGSSGQTRMDHKIDELNYLQALKRGVYLKKDLPSGYVFNTHGLHEDYYLAIPLQKGQFSCDDVLKGAVLARAVSAHSPLLQEDIKAAADSKIA